MPPRTGEAPDLAEREWLSSCVRCYLENHLLWRKGYRRIQPLPFREIWVLPWARRQGAVRWLATSRWSGITEGLLTLSPPRLSSPREAWQDQLGEKIWCLTFFQRRGGAVFKKKAVEFSKNRELNFGNGRFKPLIFFPNLACPSLKMKKIRQNQQKSNKNPSGVKFTKTPPPRFDLSH